MGIRRTSARTVLTAAVAASLVAAGSAAFAAPTAAGTAATAHGHRHLMSTLDGAHAAATAATTTSADNLMYGGGAGTPNIGVTTGKPKVYLVFWGSQWGTQGKSRGDVTLSGDAMGLAPRLQDLMKGIGTGHETWSGVMTQYCEGVAVGAQSCPADAAHVGYPAGGALAGVWVDDSAPAPTNAIDYNIGAEAVKAAGHFGNTNTEANRNVQYVVVSPSGTFPGGFNTPTGEFCAWHDYTGDDTLNGGAVPSPYGQLAFTNMPYVTDMGVHCGANYVNAGAAGALDGVTIVEGHEYAETITDQNPMGGWSDSNGWENGDKCAWKKGVPGGTANVDFPTGSFAMQGTWSNDANNGQGGCEISHPIVK